MSKNKLYVSWSAVDTYITSLSNQIKNLELDVEYITGIPRGGLVPAIMLSHRAKLKYLPYEKALDLTETRRQKVLVVDDISDSGATVTSLKIYKFKTASVYARHSSTFKPDIVGKEITVDDWLIFPWESRDSETIQDYKKQ